MYINLKKTYQHILLKNSWEIDENLREKKKIENNKINTQQCL